MQFLVIVEKCFQIAVFDKRNLDKNKKPCHTIFEDLLKNNDYGAHMKEEWVYYHDIGVDPLTERAHNHDDKIEIIWVLQGNGKVLIGDTLYQMKANHIYFIPSLVFHYTHPEEPSEYIRNKLSFSRSEMQKLLSVSNKLYILNDMERRFRAAECGDSGTFDQLDRYFKEASELHEKGGTPEDISGIGIILQILSCLHQLHLSDAYRVNPSSSLINQVLCYINLHLEDPLTLDEIADACNISKYHLCHEFRKEVNMTVMQYLTEQRITMAKITLLDTEKPISVVAAENGFANFSHFCSVFKQAEGISPAAYRKNMCDLHTNAVNDRQTRRS